MIGEQPQAECIRANTEIDVFVEFLRLMQFPFNKPTHPFCWTVNIDLNFSPRYFTLRKNICPLVS